MKFVYLALTLLFLLFCFFQLNDPDPLTWIALYGYAAVVSFLMFIKKCNNITLPIIGLLVYIITIIIDWPETFKGMENSMTIMRPEIEKARETSGMLICAAIMLVYVIIILNEKKKKPV